MIGHLGQGVESVQRPVSRLSRHLLHIETWPASWLARLVYYPVMGLGCGSHGYENHETSIARDSDATASKEGQSGRALSRSCLGSRTVNGDVNGISCRRPVSPLGQAPPSMMCQDHGLTNSARRNPPCGSYTGGISYRKVPPDSFLPRKNATQLHNGHRLRKARSERPVWNGCTAGVPPRIR